MSETENKTPQHPSIFLTLWHEIQKIIEKTGYIRTIFTSLMALFFSLIGYVVINPSIIFDQLQHYQEQIHDKKVNKRFEINPQIDNILSKIALDCDADRVWLIEYHNSIESLGGISFLYGKMTNQVARDSIVNSIGEFDELNLSAHKIMSKLVDEGYWSGTCDDLMRIDEPLSHRLQINGTKSIVMVSIYGDTCPIGVMGVSFVDKEGYLNPRLEGIIRKYSYQISNLIDSNKNK